MPDIREILAALDIDDRALWSEHRTIMRRSYLNAHNETVGMDQWTAEDDAFLDLIDIRLALLFDRAGRLDASRDILGSDVETVKDLHSKEDIVKAALKKLIHPNIIASTNLNDKTSQMTAASKLLNEGFSNASAGWGQPK